jgi:hypothetical protein
MHDPGLENVANTQEQFFQVFSGRQAYAELLPDKTGFG